MAAKMINAILLDVLGFFQGSIRFVHGSELVEGEMITPAAFQQRQWVTEGKNKDTTDKRGKGSRS